MADQPTEVTYDRLDRLVDEDPIMLRDVAWAEIGRLRADVATLGAERDELRENRDTLEAQAEHLGGLLDAAHARLVEREEQGRVTEIQARDLFLRYVRQRPVIEVARAVVAADIAVEMGEYATRKERADQETLAALAAAVDALDGAAQPSTSEPHHYVSTACQPHGLHQYCAAGIRADGSTKQAACCLHCGTPCRCGCHSAMAGEEASDG